MTTFAALNFIYAMKEISSVSNELIVNFKKLKLKKYRKEQGLYLLEGRRLVTDALTAGAPIQVCWCTTPSWKRLPGHNQRANAGAVFSAFRAI